MGDQSGLLHHQQCRKLASYGPLARPGKPGRRRVSADAVRLAVYHPAEPARARPFLLRGGGSVVAAGTGALLLACHGLDTVRLRQSRIQIQKLEQRFNELGGVSVLGTERGILKGRERCYGRRLANCPKQGKTPGRSALIGCALHSSVCTWHSSAM